MQNINNKKYNLTHFVLMNSYFLTVNQFLQHNIQKNNYLKKNCKILVSQINKQLFVI